MPPGDAIAEHGSSGSLGAFELLLRVRTSLGLELGGELLGRDLHVDALLLLVSIAIAVVIDHPGINLESINNYKRAKDLAVATGGLLIIRYSIEVIEIPIITREISVIIIKPKMSQKITNIWPGLVRFVPNRNREA